MCRAVIVVAIGLLGTIGFVGEAAAQRGERYAILVGVQKYAKNSGLRDLEFPENDVQALAKILVDSGYPEVNVALLTQKKALTENDLKFLPTRKNILAEIEGRLKLLDKEDSILIAFAGHGLQFSKEKDCWFCPADAAIDDKETLVSLTEVYKALEESKAGFKFVLCDACRNSPLSAGVRRAVVDFESVSRPQEIEPPGGVAVLYSCSPGEIAFENGSLGHGVFFHFVIDGLKGKADLDQDREVDLLELAKYAQKKVKDYVFKEYDRATQVPQLLGNTRGLFPLVTLSPGRVETPDAMPLGDAVIVVSESAGVQIGDKEVATVRKGDRFQALQEQGDWLWIQARSSTQPLGWIKKEHVRAAPPKAGPRDVLVLWEGRWWPAVILKSDGEKMLIHYYGHDDSWDEWITSERTTVVDKPFRQITHLALWKEQEWPVAVTARNGDQFLIEYVGFNSTWNEWVGEDELLMFNAVDLKRVNAGLASP